MSEPLTLDRLMQIYPFPWQEVINPNASVQVFDAQGKEVPMFIMLGFVRLATQRLVRKDGKNDREGSHS